MARAASDCCHSYQNPTRTVRARPSHLGNADFLLFRSLIVWMGACAHNSKQPVCTPASAVIGKPASKRNIADACEAEGEMDLAAAPHLRRLRS